MIRVATLEDFPALYDMALKFVKHAKCEHLCDETKVGEVIKMFLLSDRKERIVLMYENVGMLAGFVTPNVFNYDLLATEMWWWVEEDARNKDVGKVLMAGFEYWAKTVGAKHVNMTAIEDRVGKFYEKNGYEKIQTLYLKEI